MIYIYDNDELLKAVLSNENKDTCPYYFAEMSEELNGALTLEIEIPAEHPTAIFLDEQALVVAKDREGDFQPFFVREIEERHDDRGAWSKRAYCEHGIVELQDDIVNSLDLYTSSNTSLDAFTLLLADTRWEVGFSNDILITESMKEALLFENKNKLEVFNALIAFWNFEIKYRLDIEGQNIVRRSIDIETERGLDRGDRFEYDKDLKSIIRTIDTSEVKTALIGVGATIDKGQIVFKENDMMWQYMTEVKANGNYYYGAYFEIYREMREEFYFLAKDLVLNYNIVNSTFSVLNFMNYVNGIIEGNTSTNEHLYTLPATMQTRIQTWGHEFALKHKGAHDISIIDFKQINANKNYLIDEEALNNFGRLNANGSRRHRWGIYTNEDITTATELKNATQAELNRLKDPKVTYEATVIALAEINGAPYESTHLGTATAIIDKDLGITLKARIIKQVYNLVNDELTTITLGNFLPNQSTTLYKQYREINEQMQKTVYETLLESSKRGALEVDVAGFDTRITDAETTAIQAEEGLLTKVSTDDYNGVTIASKINESVGLITITADVIDLNGKVTADDLNITTTLTIGDEVRLGDLASNTWKTIYFGNTSRIESTNFGAGGFPQLKILSRTVTIDATVLTFSYALPTEIDGKELHIYAPLNFKKEPITSVKENGFCGIGGHSNGQASTAVMVGVNFRRKKAVAPSSVTFTTVLGNRDPLYTNISVEGFLLYITGNSSIGLVYWRGYYNC